MVVAGDELDEHHVVYEAAVGVPVVLHETIGQIVGAPIEKVFKADLEVRKIDADAI